MKITKKYVFLVFALLAVFGVAGGAWAAEGNVRTSLVADKTSVLDIADSNANDPIIVTLTASAKVKNSSDEDEDLTTVEYGWEANLNGLNGITYKDVNGEDVDNLASYKGSTLKVAISKTTAIATATNIVVTAKATNTASGGQTDNTGDSATISVQILDAPTITVTPNETAIVLGEAITSGVSLGVTLSDTENFEIDSLALKVNDTAINGLTIAKTGEITGTLAKADAPTGNVTVEATVKLKENATSTAKVTTTVKLNTLDPSGLTVTLNPTTYTVTGAVNGTVTFEANPTVDTVKVTGSNPETTLDSTSDYTVTWALVNEDNLPDGLTFDSSTGTFSGAPTEQKTATFQLTATVAGKNTYANLAGTSEPATVTMTITGSEKAFLKVTPDQALSSLVGGVALLESDAIGLSAEVTTGDADMDEGINQGDYTFTWTIKKGGSDTTGNDLHFKEATGQQVTLIGTPEASAEYTVEVSVALKADKSASVPLSETPADITKTETITVGAAPAAPALTIAAIDNIPASTTAMSDVTLTAELSGISDYTGYTFTWTLTGDSGLALGTTEAVMGDNTNKLTGTPSKAGTYTNAINVTVAVKDGLGYAARAASPLPSQTTATQSFTVEPAYNLTATVDNSKVWVSSYADSSTTLATLAVTPTVVGEATTGMKIVVTDAQTSFTSTYDGTIASGTAVQIPLKSSTEPSTGTHTLTIELQNSSSTTCGESQTVTIEVLAAGAVAAEITTEATPTTKAGSYNLPLTAKVVGENGEVSGYDFAWSVTTGESDLEEVGLALSGSAISGTAKLKAADVEAEAEKSVVTFTVQVTASKDGTALDPVTQQITLTITPADATVTPTNPSSGSDSTSDSGSSDSGSSGGNTDTSPTTTPEEPATEPETPATPEQNQEQNNQALDALNDGTQETQDAIDAAKEALEKAGTDVALTPEETAALVNNQKEIAAESSAEQSSGQVADTTAPAATDLPVSDALSGLNDLSVQPKVVEPEAPTEEEMARIEEKLSNPDNLDDEAQAALPDDFNPADIVTASEENIEIGSVPTGLAEQARIIERLFDLIGDLLTKMTSGGASNGVTIASSLPTLTPKTTGYFPMKMNLRHLTPGRRVRFWPSAAAFEAAANGGSVSLAAAEGSAFFLDGDGNPTTTIKGDASKMTVVPYLEAGKTYDTAFITADATEADAATLNEVVAESSSSETKSGSSSSSGGCDAGLGLGALGLFAVGGAAFLKPWRRK